MRRALIIATGAYDDARLGHLPGVAEDADGLEQVLGDVEIGDYHVTVLRDADVRSIGVAVDKFFTNAAPLDLLLLYISGHGIRDADGRLYFAARDTDHQHPRPTALSAQDVSDEMRDSAAKRIVLLLDCCHGGAFPYVTGRRAASPDDFEENRRSRGHVVMTASTAAQYAYSRDVDPATEMPSGGLFSWAVVQGLRTGAADLDGDGHIDTHELYRYVNAILATKSDKQTPTFSAYNVEGLLPVARSVLGPVRSLSRAEVKAARRRSVRQLLAAVAPTPALLRWAWQTLTPSSRGPAPRPLVAGVVAVLLVLVGCGARADSRVAPAGCPTPTTVRVATSAAALPAYQEVAEKFEDQVATGRDGCRSVDLHLYAAPAGKIRAALRTGWTKDAASGRHPLFDVGPRIEVWLPETAGDVPTADVPAVLSDPIPIAETPLVLGVRRPAGDPLPSTDRPGTRTLRQLFDAAGRPTPAGQGIGVVRGDPSSSVVAQMAVTALYGGIRDADTARRLVEQPIEEAADVYRFPAADEAELLCRERDRSGTEREAGTPAFLLTEQMLVRFNQGRPSQGSCLLGEPPSRIDQLIAYYPADTPVVQRVAVRLDWPHPAPDPTVSAYARWFTSWLADTPGKRTLASAGLRPLGQAAAEPADAKPGVLAAWPFSLPTRDEPDTADRDRAAKLYETARRPGRFLVALDTSGSMNAGTRDAALTRFEVAVAAIRGAAQRIGGADEFGLMTFSQDRGGTTRELVPIGRRGASGAAAIDAVTQRITPAGGTPLYDAIREGAKKLRAHRAGQDDDLRTLVTITDGEDSTGRPPPTKDQVAHVRVMIIAVGEAHCDAADLKALTRTTGGRCFTAGLDSVEDTLASVFRAIREPEDG